MANPTIAQDKLFIIDKRIQSFANGYRQNIALFANDSEELSYLMQTYFTGATKPSANVIHTSTKYSGERRFYKTVAASLLANIHRQPATLDTLITKTMEISPNTTSLIKKTLAGHEITFTSVLNTINTFIEETKTPCVFIIEEFQNMRKIFGTCFEEFAKFIITQRSCMVLLTSSQEESAQKILSTELNLLFGNFETIYCNNNPFTSRFAQVADELKHNPDPEFITSFFVNILDDNAIYYNHILDFINTHTIHNADDIIIKTIEDTLYNQHTYLYQKFISFIQQIEQTHKQPHVTIQTLIALSRGYTRKKDLVDMRFADAKTVESRIAKLNDDGLIICHGAINQIKDRLFAFWLANIFSFHTTYTNSVQRNALWQQHIRAEVALFKTQIQKPRIEQVRHLTCLFKDDSFSIGNETYKLPVTQRTNVSNYPEENMHLIIGEGREVMVMGVKDGDAKDSDVFSFAQKGANIKGKGVRKLFVSLGAMPDAARLAAKNHRFQAMGINELNHIMRLYNQPILALKNNHENISTL